MADVGDKGISYQIHILDCLNGCVCLIHRRCDLCKTTLHVLSREEKSDLVRMTHRSL